MECQFCKSQNINISETSKIPRGNKDFIADDDNDIEILSGWLHEMICSDCKMRVFVDKEIYGRIEE